MPRSQGALSRLAELMRRVNSSTDTEVILEEIAHGVVDVLGYGVAAIARLEGDVLVMTNVAGPPEVVAQILNRRTPAEQILDEFREADRWGILRFVPAGRMSQERLQAAWIPEVEVSADPTAWHPEHALYAPLYSAAGELLGNMAVDLPADGKVPNETDRELLEMFAVQAGVALSNARERERLTDRVHLDRMLTTVAGAATQHSLAQALRTAVTAVAESLGNVQAWVRTFPPDAQGSQLGVGTPRPFVPEHDLPELRDELMAIDDRPVLIELGVDDPSSARLPRTAPRLQQLMRRMRAERAVVCPLVSQEDLVGYLVLGFARNSRPLTPGEVDAILEVGRLLGQTVRASRVLETEQRLVQELRELARYRSELIATISHELKTPLTAILGHAELIADRHPDLTSIDAIIRNAQRLSNLVANLLHDSRIQGRREVSGGERARLALARTDVGRRPAPGDPHPRRCGPARGVRRRTGSAGAGPGGPRGPAGPRARRADGAPRRRHRPRRRRGAPRVGGPGGPLDRLDHPRHRGAGRHGPRRTARRAVAGEARARVSRPGRGVSAAAG